MCRQKTIALPRRMPVNLLYAILFTYSSACLTIDGAASRELNAEFSITGTATDNYGIGTYKITQEKDSGGEVVVSGSGFVTGGSAQSATWTLSDLPRDPETPTDKLVEDGTYVYRITVTDLAGKPSVIKTVSVTIDRTAPTTNNITAPSSGQTGVNAVSGTSYLFRGNAEDGEGGVGVAKVWYEITQNATATVIDTTPLAAGYTEIPTSGTWSFSKLLPADLAEGNGYYLHVLAEDRSGNRTATTSAASVLFDVDFANPDLTETSVNTASVVNRKAVFTLGGTAVDSHGIASITVTQKRGSEAAVPITVNPPTLGGTVTNRTWSLAGLPRNPASIGDTQLGDELYEYVITATDRAGKVHTQTRLVRFDATGPSTSFTAPAANSWANETSVTINGVSSDVSGVEACTMRLRDRTFNRIRYE